MDKCLRIVLCLSFLLFSEQHPLSPRSVKPTSETTCKGLGLRDLRTDVNCTSNLTFASPKLQESCLASAKRTFEAGLIAMQTNCTDDSDRLTPTLNALKLCKIQDHNSTACTLEQKTFTEFVDALSTFKDYYNNMFAGQSEKN